MRSITIIFLLSILTACAPAVPLATTPASETPMNTLPPGQVPSHSQIVTPSFVPFSTLTPSATSTFQPPLTEHEWNPEIVLISMRENMGDGGMLLGDLGPPPFILYADGSLFITQDVAVGNYYATRVLIKKLSKVEICQHLNTLDQAGYLDYESSSYIFIGDKPFGAGGSSTFIVVNAWKSKSDQYYDLGFYLREDIIHKLYGQNGYPVISPALRDAYYFLYEYPTDGFEVYKPDRLAIWILPVEKNFLDMFDQQIKIWEMKDWPLENLINSAKLMPDSNGEKFIILNTDEAKSVYSYLGEVIGLSAFVVEDSQDGIKKYYALFARPLLPHEMPSESYVSTIPVPGSTKPDFKLTCYPSDGILPVPASSIP